MEEKMLATAQVGKSHGVDGFLRIHPFSGQTEHLEEIEECTIRTKDGRTVKVRVKDHLFHADSFLMRFVSYESKEKAAVLSGGVMYIPRDKAARLEEGEYYIADLYGLKLVCNGEEIGTIESVAEGAQADYLMVKRVDGASILVPNMAPFVSKPDFERGTIELKKRELAY